MGNELLFFAEIILVVGFSIGAVRMGSSALAALVALQGVLANLFVVKQMELAGLTVTCSDVFAIGCMLGLNLLQEYFGKEKAQKAVKISFFITVFFVIVSQVHLWYLPSQADLTHSAFVAILSSTPRIVLASIAVYYLVQRLDVWLFGKLKLWLGDRKLGLRMSISLVATQWIDTVLFSFFGLYGIVAEIGSVILLSFLIKCTVIAAGTSLVAFSRRFAFKKVEE